jgi:hypothetical protein
MITEIGITAGDIWHYLDQHGKSSLKDVVKGIDADKDRALMSVGWLAREGHIIVERTASDYQVSLRR